MHAVCAWCGLGALSVRVRAELRLGAEFGVVLLCACCLLRSGFGLGLDWVEVGGIVRDWLGLAWIGLNLRA